MWTSTAAAAASALLLFSSLASSNPVPALKVRQANGDVDACPGYKAHNVQQTDYSLEAHLTLAGDACNAYGYDLTELNLKVVYESENRIHVKIADPEEARYQVPEEVFPRPSSADTSASSAAIQFKHVAEPFSFSIVRSESGEVLFDTADYPLIFESQYLRLKTHLPSQANIYGLGEHTETFRLNPRNTTRTLWNRDSYGIPTGTNLYGSHPVYYEHRTSGTHGVFLLSSNGMDINLRDGFLEYNILGGIVDLYFLAGPSPIEVAKQYAEVVGLPSEVPYWGLGFHNCRYGYKDYVEVAQAITNYSAAGIPLETMWTDIDYMYQRWVFTLDPEYFPLDKVQEIVDYLHEHDQHYIVMVDPATAYQPNHDYAAFDRGVEQDIFLKENNGSLYLGVVWPGVTVFPDWFAPNAQSYWNEQFARFFSAETGVDIDGVWIDMNEPANFLNEESTDPFADAIRQGNPPNRTTPPPAPGTPPFPPSIERRHSVEVDLLNPPYKIQNAAGSLSNKTAHTDLVHANGLHEYDVHNMYGEMMSVATRNAMIARRPGLKPIIITRSTFPGAGRSVGKWLGDNLSTWTQYRFSIAGQLGFASIYGVPVVGSDICGFGANTTETLCARWATLGAFSPFMRNHNELGGIPQEFYRWPLTTEASKNAIGMRYRLLDYLYTAIHHQAKDGSPTLNPLFYKYPHDPNTFAIDHQFLFGHSILVSPVTEENSTSVEFYLPEDVFYDFKTYEVVEGKGANTTLDNVDFTEIPVHIRGGAVIPLRSESAMTTTELRKKPFEIVVAPGKDGKAWGELYLDDGVSLEPAETTEVQFNFDGSKLVVSGPVNYDAKIASFSFLNVDKKVKHVSVGGKQVDKKALDWDKKTKALKFEFETDLYDGLTVELH